MILRFSRVPRMARHASAGALFATGAATALALATGTPAAQAHDRDDHGHHDNGHGKDKDRGHDNHEPDRYSIALWGDMPYNALGKTQYPALLEDVNNSDIAFSIFDGDLKAGGDGPCTRREPVHARARLLQFAAPAAGLGRGRQRLDRLLGPLRRQHDRAGRRRSDRAATARARAVRLDALQPGPAQAAPDAPVEPRRQVRPVLGERPLEDGAGGVHRHERPGLERQLPLSRCRRRDPHGRTRSPSSVRSRSRAARRTLVGWPRASRTRSASGRWGSWSSSRPTSTGTTSSA